MRTGLFRRLKKAVVKNRGVVLDQWEAARVLKVLEEEAERLYGRNRSTVERVYETRIDCKRGPGGARPFSYLSRMLSEANIVV
jgi:hypothetical protein